MLHRILAAARLLRPRAIADVQKQVAHMNRGLERLRADVADLHRTLAASLAQHDAIQRVEHRFADALLNAIPPVELFADRPFNKRQIGMPPLLAPLYSRKAWRFIANAVAPRAIVPAVLDKFHEPLGAWLDAQLIPGALARLERMEMACTDGRILLRGRGYSIPPHRDPKWGFITCLLYLARPSDHPSLGTDLYSVDGDSDALDTKPHWIQPERCRLEATVEFRPNRALIFLNSSGAHGARIPADAPESLERYIYQFRIGPGRGQMRELLA